MRFFATKCKHIGKKGVYFSMKTETDTNTDIFSETEMDVTIQDGDAPAETPEHYQIRNSQNQIIDSMRSDKGRNLSKIKEKARKLKQIYQRDKFTVVELFSRQIHTY